MLRTRCQDSLPELDASRFESGAQLPPPGCGQFLATALGGLVRPPPYITKVYAPDVLR